MSTQADLFAPRQRAASRHSHEVARLVPLARQLAFDSAVGITISKLRLAALERGYLTGHETGRQLSYLGAVMRAAGLRATDRWERSAIEQSHGNLNRVWDYPR